MCILKRVSVVSEVGSEEWILQGFEVWFPAIIGKSFNEEILLELKKDKKTLLKCNWHMISYTNLKYTVRYLDIRIDP